MIAEALLYAATWPLTGKRHRKFIRYSVNLWSRAGRCARQWAEHEEKSRNAIRAATADLRQKRTAVVLGSGLLRDVPIEELARDFDTVVLVDLVHLASVRLSAKASRNIRLIERDLSGYDALAAGGEPEPLGFLRTVPYLDFVVSANLLSQIGRGVKRRYEAEAAGMPADTVERLISAHLAGLSGLACRHCLVTDIGYAIIDRNGKTHEQADLLHGVPPPPAKATWTWPVAPLGEESRDYRIEHKVIAAW
ncbi:hypothetical protein EFR00_16385 [Rhizobium sophoriradicis]|uniref:SAM-dependent methyltransferase protein n=1 Tax=Rhizobium etli bv. mimosae str. IE4771 TaxID=1432050 RepID=A0A060HWW4_RHIET|nr:MULTISPECIES: hypothetical protein [Rhizobium]AIC26009.1 hypothetical protein IE4771_CH00855 [Rhizobium sp. IE4771]AJC78073.1 hypothetical protein IE4803_CH00828 [Rhizobium etli bv. phaseoli str. IE4803]ARQ57042.1 hypothetical protein Kim5_CH00936 [Rhizobium sp. Kim5]RSC01690.1 hypothetical protein EFR00_16385 [Rhizobium sophoriradicis]